MKTLEIKGKYIVSSDIIKLLEMLISEIEKSPCIETLEFEASSNYGGKIVAKIENHELENLRQIIN